MQCEKQFMVIYVRTAGANGMTRKGQREYNTSVGSGFCSLQPICFCTSALLIRKVLKIANAPQSDQRLERLRPDNKGAIQMSSLAPRSLKCSPYSTQDFTSPHSHFSLIKCIFVFIGVAGHFEERRRDETPSYLLA